MALTSVANRIWLASQWREYRAFLHDTKRVEQRQMLKLKAYLQKNASTALGKQYQFDSISSYAEFTKKVPIHKWEDIQNWVDKIDNDNSHVLTSEKVLAFEETSGTTSYAKLVPYTNTLKQEFQRGVAAWICAMYQEYPQAFQGSSYWSISPATKELKRTKSGIRIGLESDDEYFGFFTQLLLKQILAIPPKVSRLKDPKEFYLQTFLHLAQTPSLSLISVWSPTFLIQMDEFLRKHRDEIAEKIKESQRKTSTFTGEFQEKIKDNYSWKDLWPKISLVSCWTHAQASIWLPALQKRVGNVPIQPKGLLSTEGVCSIPIRSNLDPVLAIRSHFYEFLSIESNRVYLGHELKEGEVYEIILTTAGGLYRYASGDLVRVTSFLNKTPCFVFLGRKHAQSDLVGEKLSEAHLIRALAKLPSSFLDKIDCIFFYPTISEKERPIYGCYVEVDPKSESFSKTFLKKQLLKIERELFKNPYYAQAVKIGQLGSMRMYLLHQGEGMRLKNHLKQRKNIKDGDLKIPILFPKDSLSMLHPFGLEKISDY